MVAKAWEHIIHLGSRGQWAPERVLVTGAGPIGLLATLFATRLGGEVHVLDRASDGPKPDLVRDLGAVYHEDGRDSMGEEYDVVVECTGDANLMVAVAGVTKPNGIVCFAGVTDEGHQVTVASDIARAMVLENRIVFGTVNANRRHYEEAARVLARADESWLGRLVNRRVSLDDWKEAYTRRPDDVKTVIEFLPRCRCPGVTGSTHGATSMPSPSEDCSPAIGAVWSMIEAISPVIIVARSGSSVSSSTRDGGTHSSGPGPGHRCSSSTMRTRWLRDTVLAASADARPIWNTGMP